MNNMPRGSGSRRFIENAYPLLLEKGPLNTDQIMESLNQRQVFYTGAPKGRKTTETWSIHQTAQILRTARWFVKVGEERVKSFGGSRRVLFIYDVRPVEEVVSTMVGFKHSIQKRSTLPSFAEAEYKKQTEAIQNAN